MECAANAKSTSLPTKDTDDVEADVKSVGGVGCRRVLTLSQAQLERKRAHDRDAQRAARQRTKKHIEGLERRIQSLSELSPTQNELQLAAANQRTMDLMQELAVMKSKLGATLEEGNRASEAGQICGLDFIGPEFDHSDSLNAIDSAPFIYECPLESASVYCSSTVDNNARYLATNADTVDLALTSRPVSQSISSCTAKDTRAVPASFVGQTKSSFWEPHASQTRAPDVDELGSEWQLVNHVFVSADRATRNLAPAENFEVPWQDMCVRAVLEGWDSINHIVGHIPLWQNLRLIDQIVCGGLAVIEKLAGLFIMYVRLNWLSNPTSENEALVPRWYMHSACHTDYAIQSAYYLVWPGLREKLKYSPRRFSCNAFWIAFKSNMRILWPYEVRDCYRRNPTTNIYDLSPTFEQHVRNIKCWATNAELFIQYPELRIDMPCVDEIPSSLSGTCVAQFRFARPADFTYTEGVRTRRRRSRGKFHTNTRMAADRTSKVFDSDNGAMYAPTSSAQTTVFSEGGLIPDGMLYQSW